MKKLFVTCSITIVCLLLINFAIMFAYKQAFTKLLEMEKTKLSENGIGFTYRNTDLKGFFAWDMELDILDISITSGNKNEKITYSLNKLTVSSYPLKNKIVIKLLDDILLKKEYSNSSFSEFGYKFKNPIINLSIKSYLEMILDISKQRKNIMHNIREFSYLDNGLDLYDKSDNDKLVLSINNNSLSVKNNINPTENSKDIDIKFNVSDCLYNSDYNDSEVKQLSSLGTINLALDFNYINKEKKKAENILGQDKTDQDFVHITEKFTIKKLKFNNVKFGFEIGGNFTNYSNDNRSLDVDVYINKYNDLLEFSAKLLKVYLPEVQEVNNEQIFKIAYIIIGLPEIVLNNDDISFKILMAKEEGVLRIGGTKWSDLAQKLLAAFIPEALPKIKDNTE